MFKYLYFANSLSDAVCMPAELLRATKVNSSSTELTFEFKDVQDGIGTEVSITLNTVENRNKAVVTHITDAIRKSKRPFIVIADEINNEFIHPDITAVKGDSLIIT